jgi:hypothetical protein
MALDAWAAQHGSTASFEMSVSTSNWFLTRREAQLVIEAGRREYNEEWTHRLHLGCDLPGVHQHLAKRAHMAQESTSLAVV